MATRPIGWGPDNALAATTLPEQVGQSGQNGDPGQVRSEVPRQETGSRRGVWGFQPAEAGWRQNLLAYQAFCQESGRRPRARGQDPQERRLARWISSQRQDYRALILPAARKEQLDEHVPDWAD